MVARPLRHLETGEFSGELARQIYQQDNEAVLQGTLVSDCLFEFFVDGMSGTREQVRFQFCAKVTLDYQDFFVLISLAQEFIEGFQETT
ncbi:hypothetical protein BpHYR1_002570 [Brachionus plicatilis]|uniref:Uncharacterized protein n=1 Tax=Brachionus plicatilis TaxID=10195 RepID=A0A3M7RGP4_BRAPC|nr:hypothetical protein BpHYR1_002570 [Brachionus plicatilis]